MCKVSIQSETVVLSCLILTALVWIIKETSKKTLIFVKKRKVTWRVFNSPDRKGSLFSENGIIMGFQGIERFVSFFLLVFIKVLAEVVIYRIYSERGDWYSKSCCFVSGGAIKSFEERHDKVMCRHCSKRFKAWKSISEDLLALALCIMWKRASLAKAVKEWVELISQVEILFLFHANTWAIAEEGAKSFHLHFYACKRQRIHETLLFMYLWW